VGLKTTGGEKGFLDGETGLSRLVLQNNGKPQADKKKNFAKRKRKRVQVEWWKSRGVH